MRSGATSRPEPLRRSSAHAATWSGTVALFVADVVVVVLRVCGVCVLCCGVLCCVVVCGCWCLCWCAMCVWCVACGVWRGLTPVKVRIFDTTAGLASRRLYVQARHEGRVIGKNPGCKSVRRSSCHSQCLWNTFVSRACICSQLTPLSAPTCKSPPHKQNTLKSAIARNPRSPCTKRRFVHASGARHSPPNRFSNHYATSYTASVGKHCSISVSRQSAGPVGPCSSSFSPMRGELCRLFLCICRPWRTAKLSSPTSVVTNPLGLNLRRFCFVVVTFFTVGSVHSSLSSLARPLNQSFVTVTTYEKRMRRLQLLKEFKCTVTSTWTKNDDNREHHT